MTKVNKDDNPISHQRYMLAQERNLSQHALLLIYRQVTDGVCMSSYYELVCLCTTCSYCVFVTLLIFTDDDTLLLSK